MHSKLDFSLQFYSALVDAACMQKSLFFSKCISIRTFICFFYSMNYEIGKPIFTHKHTLNTCDYLLKCNAYRIEIITHNNITVSAI